MSVELHVSNSFHHVESADADEKTPISSPWEKQIPTPPVQSVESLPATNGSKDELNRQVSTDDVSASSKVKSSPTNVPDVTSVDEGVEHNEQTDSSPVSPPADSKILEEASNERAVSGESIDDVTRTTSNIDSIIPDATESDANAHNTECNNIESHNSDAIERYTISRDNQPMSNEPPPQDDLKEVSEKEGPMNSVTSACISDPGNDNPGDELKDYKRKCITLTKEDIPNSEEKEADYMLDNAQETKDATAESQQNGAIQSGVDDQCEKIAKSNDEVDEESKPSVEDNTSNELGKEACSENEKEVSVSAEQLKADGKIKGISQVSVSTDLLLNQGETIGNLPHPEQKECVASVKLKSPRIVVVRLNESSEALANQLTTVTRSVRKTKRRIAKQSADEKITSDDQSEEVTRRTSGFGREIKKPRIWQVAQPKKKRRARRQSSTTSPTKLSGRGRGRTASVSGTPKSTNSKQSSGRRRSTSKSKISRRRSVEISKPDSSGSEEYHTTDGVELKKRVSSRRSIASQRTVSYIDVSDEGGEEGEDDAASVVSIYSPIVDDEPVELQQNTARVRQLRKSDGPVHTAVRGRGRPRSKHNISVVETASTPPTSSKRGVGRSQSSLSRSSKYRTTPADDKLDSTGQSMENEDSLVILSDSPLQRERRIQRRNEISTDRRTSKRLDCNNSTPTANKSYREVEEDDSFTDHNVKSDLEEVKSTKMGVVKSPPKSGKKISLERRTTTPKMGPKSKTRISGGRCRGREIDLDVEKLSRREAENADIEVSSSRPRRSVSSVKKSFIELTSATSQDEDDNISDFAQTLTTTKKRATGKRQQNAAKSSPSTLSKVNGGAKRSKAAKVATKSKVSYRTKASLKKFSDGGVTSDFEIAPLNGGNPRREDEKLNKRVILTLERYDGETSSSCSISTAPAPFEIGVGANRVQYSSDNESAVASDFSGDGDYGDDECEFGSAGAATTLNRQQRSLKRKRRKKRIEATKEGKVYQ